jgi:hypothetical protein
LEEMKTDHGQHGWLLVNNDFIPESALEILFRV